MDRIRRPRSPGIPPTDPSSNSRCRDRTALGTSTVGYLYNRAGADIHCSPNSVSSKASSHTAPADIQHIGCHGCDRTSNRYRPGNSYPGCRPVRASNRPPLHSTRPAVAHDPESSCDTIDHYRRQSADRILDPSTGSPRSTPLAPAQKVRFSSFPPNDLSRRGRARKERECAHTLWSIYPLSAVQSSESNKTVEGRESRVEGLNAE
jgi:hypothetical protein